MTSSRTRSRSTSSTRVPARRSPTSRPLAPSDALRAIAIFRLMFPDIIIRYAGGRELVLRDAASPRPGRRGQRDDRRQLPHHRRPAAGDGHAHGSTTSACPCARRPGERARPARSRSTAGTSGIRTRPCPGRRNRSSSSPLRACGCMPGRAGRGAERARRRHVVVVVGHPRLPPPGPRRGGARPARAHEPRDVRRAHSRAGGGACDPARGDHPRAAPARIPLRLRLGGRRGRREDVPPVLALAGTSGAQPPAHMARRLLRRHAPARCRCATPTAACTICGAACYRSRCSPPAPPDGFDVPPDPAYVDRPAPARRGARRRARRDHRRAGRAGRGGDALPSPRLPRRPSRDWPTSTTCCSCSTRSPPGSAAPAPSSPPSTPA